MWRVRKLITQLTYKDRDDGYQVRLKKITFVCIVPFEVYLGYMYRVARARFFVCLTVSPSSTSLTPY